VADAFPSPFRPDAVIAGSRLAKLTNFIANEDSVRPIRFAISTISGFVLCIFPNEVLQ
jgi:hypothetical protein